MLARTLAIGLAVLAACKSSGTPPSPPANKVDGPGDKTEAQKKRELRDTVLGVNAHVIVLKSQTAFAEYRDVLATVERHPNVVAAEAFYFVELIASAPGGTPTSMVAKGVDPARVGKVLALGKTMTKGSIAVLAESGTGAPPIIGDALAKKLGAGVGDEIQLASPPGDAAPPKSPRPRVFRVAGIFHTGFEEYDQRLTYTSLSAIQALLDSGDTAIGVEAVVKDLATSEATAKAIEKEIGGAPYVVMDWFELNRALFVTRD